MTSENQALWTRGKRLMDDVVGRLYTLKQEHEDQATRIIELMNEARTNADIAIHLDESLTLAGEHIVKLEADKDKLEAQQRIAETEITDLVHATATVEECVAELETKVAELKAENERLKAALEAEAPGRRTS